MILAIWLVCLWAICAAQEERKVTDACNEFGFRLLHEMPASSEVNLFFSPYSVSSALAMAYVGSRGDTQRELHETLGYSSAELSPVRVLSAHAQHINFLRQPSNSTVRVANAAVIKRNYSVRREYLDSLSQSFDAELWKVNFLEESSRRNINDWAKNKTEGKIEELIGEPFPENTKLVLLNAIYFRGLWKSRFRVRDTYSDAFYNGGTQRVAVDTMHQEVHGGYAYDRETNADVIDLPYVGLDYSMTIVLPKDRTGVDTLRRRLSWRVFQRMLSELHETTLTVALPRFKLEGSYRLKELLSQLGVEKLFQEQQADLSGISRSRDLFVKDVIHKAVVEVDEQGSAAAGATDVLVVEERFHPTMPFVVDHPFLFFIRNTKTGDVLFAGQVNHL